MSVWSRIWNVFRSNRLNREIDGEFESHIQEAIADGRDPDEARRAFGPPLLMRENVRDISLIPWLESIRADAIFGWRQLKKNKITSAAAILSLALALGACTSAFRLIDALLLRPLPVAGADRLYVVSRQGLNFNGVPGTFDGTEYPLFEQMRAAVGWALGMGSTKYIQSLLYQVSSKEPHIIALPLLAILAIMVLAILPALSRALRIDPAETLRSE